MGGGFNAGRQHDAGQHFAGRRFLSPRPTGQLWESQLQLPDLSRLSGRRAIRHDALPRDAKVQRSTWTMRLAEKCKYFNFQYTPYVASTYE